MTSPKPTPPALAWACVWAQLLLLLRVAPACSTAPSGAGSSGPGVADGGAGAGTGFPTGGGLPEFPTVASEPDAEVLGAGPDPRDGAAADPGDASTAGPVADGPPPEEVDQADGASPAGDVAVPDGGGEGAQEVTVAEPEPPDTAGGGDSPLAPDVTDVPSGDDDADAGPAVPECTTAQECAIGKPLPEPCHAWVCDPLLGCQQQQHPPGTACSTDACKAAQVCSAGSCIAGVTILCDDGDPCTQDGCHPLSGCSHLPIPGCCVPDCDFKSCGADGCGGTCGECAAGAVCQNPGVCVTCATQCGGKQCGPDGCGGSCGTCPEPQECGAGGLCEGCLPDCSGKLCGDDGCGGSCGACQAGWACDEAGACYCAASCVGRECGTDGCTGSCGECNSSETCSPGGACVVPSNDFGESCLKPFTVAGSLPYVIGSSTQGLKNDVWTAGPCGQAVTGLGGDSGDQVHGFTPEVTGYYKVSLSAQYAAAIIVFTSCEDPVGSCIAAISSPGGATSPGGSASTGAWLEAGVLAFIAVDGAGNGANDSGPYTLIIDYVDTAGCMPDCTGKKCGNDGCGGVCGKCSFDQICGGGGVCLAGFGGDSCDGPYVIQALPFVASSTGAGEADDYAFSEGACDGVPGAHGAGVSDQAYELTAQTNANFTFEVTGPSDPADGPEPVVSLVWSCGDPDGLCIGAATTGATLTRFFPVGTTVHLIVDSAGPYTLTVDTWDNPACTTTCGAAQCGSDGCGGECGSCGPGPSCVGGVCASATQGTTCETPWVIGTAPFKALHTTELATSDFAYPGGACAGESDGFGDLGPDHVYAFTPLASGTYLASVDATFDSGLYVVTSCEDVAGSCVGALNATTGIETLLIDLDAGVPYLFVVDDATFGGPMPGPYTFELAGPF